MGLIYQHYSRRLTHLLHQILHHQAVHQGLLVELVLVYLVMHHLVLVLVALLAGSGGGQRTLGGRATRSYDRGNGCSVGLVAPVADARGSRRTLRGRVAMDYGLGYGAGAGWSYGLVATRISSTVGRRTLGGKVMDHDRNTGTTEVLCFYGTATGMDSSGTATDLEFSRTPLMGPQTVMVTNYIVYIWLWTMTCNIRINVACFISTSLNPG